MIGVKKEKIVHADKYVLKIEVCLIEDHEGWGPYLTVEDATRLDDAREALRQGDIGAASQYGQVYELHPISK